MSQRRHKLADALAQRPGLDRDPGPERGHSFLLAPGERDITIHRFVSLPYLRPQSSMAAQPTASSGTRIGLPFCVVFYLLPTAGSMYPACSTIR